VLQAYLNQPSLRVFVNLEEKLAELGQMLDCQPEKIFRIGTGEFADSLALDQITGWTNTLLPFFSSRRNAILELKTKTEAIEGLFSSRFRDRIVVSWSVNSPFIAATEEHGAPGIRQRIEAAKRCQLEGYAVGFHFDPLIEHPKWKDGYLKTLEMMEKHIDPKRVIWVSLGCLRYLPVLKTIIRSRRPDTHILDGEFIAASDHKMRYFKPIRIEMYGFLAERLKEWHEDLGLYLCMESDEVWEESLGWSPKNSQGLSRYLDLRVRKFFDTPGSQG
jgi:spore photoproduct lyase